LRSVCCDWRPQAARLITASVAQFQGISSFARMPPRPAKPCASLTRPWPRSHHRTRRARHAWFHRLCRSRTSSASPSRVIQLLWAGQRAVEIRLVIFLVEPALFWCQSIDLLLNRRQPDLLRLASCAVPLADDVERHFGPSSVRRSHRRGVARISAPATIGAISCWALPGKE
jgi:hypothetical protein